MNAFAPTSLQLALATIGSFAGIVYAGLGIAALKHLPSADSSDRVFGWSLWWFTQSSRYTAQGQSLCRKGGVAFAISAAAWVAWFVLRS